MIEKAEPNCTIGRLLWGEVAKRSCAQNEHPVGRYFVDVARLEAASIIAFRELARDLACHGARQELVTWAQRAALEETEHANSCRALARRYRVNVEAAQVTGSGTRSLSDIALDNAYEGLTREAFGALIAHHQMQVAADPAVRTALERIAHDETRHAEFSIALYQWPQTRLDPTERASVHAARQQARSEMGPTLHQAYAPEVIVLAGLPTPEYLSRFSNSCLRKIGRRSTILRARWSAPSSRQDCLEAR